MKFTRITLTLGEDHPVKLFINKMVCYYANKPTGVGSIIETVNEFNENEFIRVKESVQEIEEKIKELERMLDKRSNPC